MMVFIQNFSRRRKHSQRERERENAICGAAGRKEGRKEGRRAVVDGQFLNANNGGVERGLADENAGEVVVCK